MRDVNVHMKQSVQGACKKKVARSPVNPNMQTAKQKQSERTKARASDAQKSNRVGYMQWPVEPPEGVTILHVEFDVAPKNQYEAEQARRTWNAFPRPGNQEVQDFYKKVRETFGPKVRVTINEPRIIKELVPKGVPIRYRKGAFEVVNLNTGKLLFSKLQTGASLVYEGYWDRFAKQLKEQMEA